MPLFGQLKMLSISLPSNDSFNQVKTRSEEYLSSVLLRVQNWLCKGFVRLEDTTQNCLSVGELWWGNTAFHKMFIVKMYLMSKTVGFKVLLALNKFHRCPQELDITHPHIQLKYLLHSTNSFVRVHDQEIITTFKSYHTHRTFCTVLDANEETIKCQWMLEIVRRSWAPHDVYGGVHRRAEVCGSERLLEEAWTRSTEWLQGFLQTVRQIK